MSVWQDLVFWVLDGHVPREGTPSEWSAMWADPESRRVARDTVGDIDVSTVFLGIDHAMDGGPPLLFETMTFGPVEDTWRYATWDEAVAGHARVVAALREGRTP